MTPHLNIRGWRRALGAHWTIDESTNVGLAQHVHGPDAVRAGFWLTGGGVYFFWNVCTALGALGANALGNPAAWGLDAAVPAAFAGLLWPRLSDWFTRGVAAVAMITALGFTPVLPAGTAIIATVIVAVAVGWRERS
jgi:predicted branched-subunit amino acid permease